MLTLQKTKLAIIIAIFLLLTVSLSSDYNSCKAATQISLLEELDHVVEINEYGFLIINETMMFYNNYSMTLSVPQVTLTYPPSYFSKMSLVNITDNRFALSISKTTDFSRCYIVSQSRNSAQRWSINQCDSIVYWRKLSILWK